MDLIYLIYEWIYVYEDPDSDMQKQVSSRTRGRRKSAPARTPYDSDS